jgi:Ca-activated chloride channel homolog
VRLTKKKNAFLLLATLSLRSAAMMIFISAAVVIALSQSQTLINNDSALERTPAVTIRKQVQEVNLVVTVTDHRGRLVRDLRSSDFNIQDNGELPKRITYFERQANLPLRIAVVVDTSSSIAESFAVEEKTAGLFLTRSLRPGSDLALVIGFANKPRVEQSATDDTKLLSRTIRGLHVGGETAIYDAVSAAARELGKITDLQPARRVIILITDGKDNFSQIDLQQAVEVAQRNDCFVYVLSTNTDISSEAESAERAMKRLSEATGGNVLRANTEDNLVKAFSDLEKELRSQYAIGYTPANLARNGSFHRLVVQGPKKLRIYYREGYFAR